VLWSAPAERSGDGALFFVQAPGIASEVEKASKAPSPLRSAGALQIGERAEAPGLFKRALMAILLLSRSRAII